MNRVNQLAAALLVSDIETHPAVFLNEWKYADVKGLTKPQLDAAWVALKDRSATKTRLVTFA